MRADCKVNDVCSKSNWTIHWPSGLLRAKISRFNYKAEVRGSGSEMLGPTSKIWDLNCSSQPFNSLPNVDRCSSGELVRDGRHNVYFSFMSNTQGLITFWSVHSVLESYILALEKILTTSHPFYAKPVCHRPQRDYQESGREQMWPTPNWLHQHSLCLLVLFPLLFFFYFRICTKRTSFSIQSPSQFCWSQHVSCTLQAPDWSFHLLISVSGKCRCTNCSYHLKAIHVEYLGPPPIQFPPLVEFMKGGCMCSSTKDKIWPRTRSKASKTGN